MRNIAGYKFMHSCIQNKERWQNIVWFEPQVSFCKLTKALTPQLLYLFPHFTVGKRQHKVLYNQVDFSIPPP